MKLSIIIVSWNVCDHLKRCLDSIYKYTQDIQVEIIVVDNASTDQTTKMIRDEFKDVVLIENLHNMGFAAANNQGIEKSSGDYILLLNPDTLFIENSLNYIFRLMDKYEKIGVVGCKHLNPNHTLQPSVRTFPTISAMLAIFLKLHKLVPNLPPLRHYLLKDFNYNISQPVDQVAGSFMMIRREVMRKLGGLDEQFFIWFEEVDFCKRTVDTGYMVWYIPNVGIIHYGGQSFIQQTTLKKQWLFFKSAWQYFKKHGFFNN